MLFRSMNVNIDFFRRFSAENKAKMADSLTDSQVQRMNLDTLSRIIKEACTEANYRTVYISRDLRVSNGWNSELEMVSCAKRFMISEARILSRLCARESSIWASDLRFSYAPR